MQPQQLIQLLPQKAQPAHQAGNGTAQPVEKRQDGVFAADRLFPGSEQKICPQREQGERRHQPHRQHCPPDRLAEEVDVEIVQGQGRQIHQGKEVGIAQNHQAVAVGDQAVAAVLCAQQHRGRGDGKRQMMDPLEDGPDDQPGKPGAHNLAEKEPAQKRADGHHVGAVAKGRGGLDSARKVAPAAAAQGDRNKLAAEDHKRAERGCEQQDPRAAKGQPCPASGRGVDQRPQAAPTLVQKSQDHGKHVDQKTACAKLV